MLPASATGVARTSPIWWSPRSLFGGLNCRSCRDGEEVDRESRASSGFDVMVDAGRDALGQLRVDDHVGRGIGLRDEAKLALRDPQSAPGPGGQAMRSTERSRNGALVPGRRRSHQHQTIGDLAAIAERTVQHRAHAAGALDLVLDPGRQEERRTMPYMTAVTAVEMRHPVTDVVALEAHDPTVHDDELVKAWNARRDAIGHTLRNETEDRR